MQGTTTIRKALTIAGSDSGGGAGIQADLKTFQELGVYGMSAVTAITAQNTLGVHAVFPAGASAVAAQLNAIGDDLPPDAVKTGMLVDAEVIETVADAAAKFGWRNIVIDPVMIAKGGTSLLASKALSALIDHLLPLSAVITPNLPEAELLAGMSIATLSDREEAAKRLLQMGTGGVILKGGHDSSTKDSAVDLLYDGSRYYYVESKRIDTAHTHGTGCTFSAAVAAELAKGASLLEAMHTAKAFIQAAIEHSLGFGKGHGPTNHFAYKGLEKLD
ncbi:bifunctional hydroxymethylpyrimidine kinase/phosphomethylpyrimidine kinase [Paenibacillus sp. GCM10027627]|uniref:bifunctional hydroxymethylpyrimidine kinase/phosphomethylpyrimidine kinase n=1 Tax=unclassified Paenibacillus TaxID=185978 RepID=UPI0036261760